MRFIQDMEVKYVRECHPLRHGDEVYTWTLTDQDKVSELIKRHHTLSGVQTHLNLL